MKIDAPVDRGIIASSSEVPRPATRHPGTELQLLGMESSNTAIAELANRLKELGRIMVLDLAQATTIRSIHSFWIHDGTYYLAPPPGVKASEVERILDEYRQCGEIHFDYNVQSSMDVPHRPILPLDSFAETYFVEREDGLLKITAVARNKLAELNALLDEFKLPFDPAAFPYLDSITLTTYRPGSKDHQATVAFVPLSNDWKVLREVEESVRRYLSENNYSKEILVARHSVRGLNPEIALTSTDETTSIGAKFLEDLAAYLGEHSLSPEELDRLLSEAGPPPLSPHEPELEQFNLGPRPKPVEPDFTPAERYRKVLETMRDTLKSMKLYAGLDQSITGQTLLIHFSKKNMLGFGGHFGKDHLVSLESAYRAARRTPKLEKGWASFYHYDSDSRLLSVRATSEEEKAPAGWRELKSEF